jgi:hypothetical protein
MNAIIEDDKPRVCLRKLENSALHHYREQCLGEEEG